MTTSTKLRATAQRAAILDEVRRSHDHPTAGQVHERVRRRVRNVSLGTVYRNLAVLHQAGEIRQIELAGEPARFDGELQPHDHVRCTRCGRVEDVPAVAGDGLATRAAEQTGYRIVGRRVEFVGLCPDCRNPSRS